MNAAAPDLLMLLHWAAELSAGRRCAQWETWCAQAPDAAAKWEQITLAQELLAGSSVVDFAADEIPAEDLAAYLEGGLDAASAKRIEEHLWRSPEQLAEALSSVRFSALESTAQTSPELRQRLAAIQPERMNGHAHAKPERYRLAPAVGSKPSQWLAPEDRPMAAIVVPEPAAARGQPPIALSHWQWPAVAAALVLIISLSGVLGWLAIGGWRADGVPPMANRPDQGEMPDVRIESPAPPSPPTREEDLPQAPAPVESAPAGPVPAEPVVLPVENAAPSAIAPSKEVPAAPQAAPAPASRPAPPPVEEPPRAVPDVREEAPPQPAPRRRGLPPPPELAIHSPQGILLVNGGKGGAWRVAKDRHLLREPARFLSLAESWSAADIPDLATLICEGSTEMGLSQLIDGVVEIRLERGRVGIRGLREGAEVRVVAGPAVWTARGLTGDSTLAVMYDPLSPGIAVPTGHIAIDDTPIDTRQILRWQNGALSPYEPAQAVDAARGNVVAPPPVFNPWDLDWLAPQDQTRQQQWRSVYGRLVDRLAEANDFEAELARMLATSRENRHMALLAHWSATSEPPARRAQRLWNMLRERRLAVRIAGVTCLLELPPGDLRREEILTFLQDATDETTRGRVTEWLDATRQAVPLTQEQAVQLSNCLTHEELAVRQIAVSLLELHTTTALLRAGQRSPTYDAAGPAARRGAAQQEWRALLRKLFTSAPINTGGRAALGPAALKPVP